MGDLKELLRRGDPLADSPELSPIDAQVMRRRIVSAARESGAMPLWPRPLAVAAMLALTLTTGVLIGQHLSPSSPAADLRASSAPSAAIDGRSASVTTRQLHFATPGGTRIIWVFNPDFKLSGD